MKKLATILFSLVLVMALTVTAFAGSGLDNFQKKNTYKAGQFSDVKASSTEWYVTSVKAAYEYGLILGNDNGTFGVSDNLTIAQTLAIASRLNNIYNGGTGEFDQTQGNMWYDVYVDYCTTQGIIKSGEYSNYNSMATRAQFVSILANAFPDSALNSINTVEYIPDVNESASYYKAAIKLYRAGILTGSTGNKLMPNDNIKRTEVAAIITRMADTSLRQSVTLKKDNGETTVDPTPTPDPDPTPDVTVNTKAYDYLVKYVKNDSYTQKSDGNYINMYAGAVSDDQTSGSIYMLMYSESENALAVMSMHSNVTGENEEFGSMLLFDSKLSTPYNASFSIGSGEDVYFAGTTTINPATFKASVDNYVFSDTQGEFANNNTYTKKFASTMSSDLAIALYYLEQQILTNGKYTLSDLGFGDIDVEDLINDN